MAEDKRSQADKFLIGRLSPADLAMIGKGMVSRDFIFAARTCETKGTLQGAYLLYRIGEAYYQGNGELKNAEECRNKAKAIESEMEIKLRRGAENGRR